MAMYYYASKLNEASCSNRCPMQVLPVPAEPAPVPGPPPAPEQSSIVADPSLLRPEHGLSYYGSDAYYRLVRKNKLMFDSACLSNGCISFGSSQKTDDPQTSSKTGARPKDRKPEIEYRNGEVVAATMEALIDMVRPGTSKAFKFTFLLCSRLVTKPHEILAILCKKYFKDYDQLKEMPNVDVQVLHMEKDDMAILVSLLTEWIIMFPYDFRDDRMMALVRYISERCAAEHMTEVRAVMSITLEKLLDKLTALERYEETLMEVPRMSCADHLAQDDIILLGLTPTALAGQLTLVELYRLSYVGPEEFVQAFVPPDNKTAQVAVASTSTKVHQMEPKCTRNLEAYADWFNRLSYIVASDIVKNPKCKYRARVIEQWVMTARECFNIGNFNSLMAIISGLNMSPISRLKKTWTRTSDVCIQQLRQLELCVDPRGNHARYRSALAAAPSETAVPLLSVTCRDLHFANQASTCRMSNNRVNFEKWSVLSRFVENQLAARRILSSPEYPTPRPAPPHPGAWRFLNDRPTLTEKGLELTSFERESPLDNLERERMKRLRNAS